MTYKEIQAALKSFTVLVDTREHPNKKFKKRIKSMGVPAVWYKLNYGDYSARVTLPDKSEFSLENKVCVERKMSLDELAKCYSSQRKRFEREFERAAESNAKIYLLIENGDFDKAYKGDYRSQMKPKALTASIFTWLARYKCNVIFCSSELSGQIIKEILYREMKERLCTFGGD
jgi:ERCC4-type nuclease